MDGGLTEPTECFLPVIHHEWLVLIGDPPLRGFTCSPLALLATNARELPSFNGESAMTIPAAHVTSSTAGRGMTRVAKERVGAVGTKSPIPPPVTLVSVPITGETRRGHDNPCAAPFSCGAI